MIVIWRGNGILVPVFFVFFIVMAIVFARAVFGDAAKPYGHFFFALAAALAALSVWFTGRVSNSKDPGVHTFFFIKAEYWAFPIGLLAIYYLVTPGIDI